MARTIKFPSHGPFSNFLITLPILFCFTSSMTTIWFYVDLSGHGITRPYPLMYFDFYFSVPCFFYTVLIVLLIYWVKKSDSPSSTTLSTSEGMETSASAANDNASETGEAFKKLEKMFAIRERFSRHYLNIAVWGLPVMVVLFLVDVFRYRYVMPDTFFYISCVTKAVIALIAYAGVSVSLPSITIKFENVSAEEQIQDFTRREQQMAERDARLFGKPMS